MTSRLRPACRAVALLAWAAVASAAAAATFTVTNTADSGAGSLRQAIIDANGNPGLDTIAFSIPGVGVQTIAVPTALPAITDPIVIDGYTQPGSSPNTDAAASNAVILIEVSGAFTEGLAVSSTSAEIRGLAILGFDNGIHATSVGSTVIDGNFIGIHADGSPGAGDNVGVLSDGAGITVGGATPGARNVISGNAVGIRISDSGGGAVLGNLVGPDPMGTSAIGNSNGIAVTTNVRIGGMTAAEGNVISGNSSDGVHLQGSGSIVQGNRIGLDATGFQPLGNGGSGIVVDAGGHTINNNFISANASHGIDLAGGNSSTVFLNDIGTNVAGTGELGNGGAGIHMGLAFVITLGDGNLITNNAVGIWVESPQFNLDLTIGKNSIYANGGLGIVFLGPPPAIHPGGVPMITSVIPGATTTTIEGYWDFGSPGMFQGGGINFYTSPACAKKRPWHFDEGKTYFGSVGVGGGGHMTFSYVAPVVITDEVVTANASYTICVPQCFVPGEGGIAFFKGSTPFSQRLPYAIDPASGSAAGGDPFIIVGTNFQAGATVTVGGAPGGNVNIVGPGEIDLTAPALPAGAAYDVTVVNLDGTRGTIPLAWLADFLDVPQAHMFHDFVRKVVTNGIATGVGGGNYGVDAGTLRQQMAVFLLKAKHGYCYTPPPCAGLFADVPCPSPFADWIEALAAEGITGGCGGGNYCPSNPNTRGQMAVFLTKTFGLE